MRKFAIPFAAFGLCLAMAAPALAENIEVHMLNKGAEGAMVFEPAYIKANPGDTITFIPIDKGHNVESVKDMIPAAAEKFKSKINENYVLTVSEPGAYFVKCTPHYAMGMVALIVVGDNPANLDEIVAAKKPKPVQARLEKAIASAK
ncbi:MULTISPECIES: pseudoazurin [Brucella/Ochrobactrum group]|uniref:pseudoazurin n=1 Tax=Brucella/Ochrobactrum group TaxID=2826938 RepID=UPI001655B38F|nr:MULTISPECIES: pseudoazurin [Brucella/Ochrobactrum group]MBC8718337.1 pseudoazurin [Ochrobactrum sp. Marseille-Q0166]